MPRQKKEDDLSTTTRIIESNKWAKASVRATQLKCLLDEILNKDFSEEEKQSTKYRKLIETVDFHFGQVLSEYNKVTGSHRVIDNSKELELLKKKSPLLGWRTAIIAGIGMAGLKIFEWLIALIFTWLTSGGKTP